MFPKKVAAAISLAAAMSVLCLCGCSSGKLQTHEYYTYFDTLIRLQIYADDEEAEDIFEKFEASLKRYSQLFDIYDDYPGIQNLKTINDQAGIEPVRVDAEIIDMLQLGLDIYERSGGKVNIAMGSVLSIWHEYREKGMERPNLAKLPPMETLRAAAAHTRIEDVVIDENLGTVYLADADMSLDVGAIAKGYAAARLSEDLKSWGVTSGLLDLGGNIVAVGGKRGSSGIFGRKRDGDSLSPDAYSAKDCWRLGLQNPDTESEESLIHVILLADQSIVTSGDYQRYYTVDGKKYHHIIDTETLMPTTYFSAVSVIAADSGQADALSTALFSMDEASGRRMLESLDGVEALWVYPDGSESMTDGFAQYIE